MVKELSGDFSLNKSVYYELREFHNKNERELYSFQNFEKAGIKEFEIITGRVRELKNYEKNRLANELMKIVLNIIDNKDELTNLEGYVILNPIINYYIDTRKLCKSIMENNRRIKKELSMFVKKILLESNNYEIIKFGLILAPLLNIENIEEILDVFSIHNNYLFYVINAYDYMDGYSKKIFEIAKKSKGYGRVFSTIALKPATYEMEKWLIEEACNNSVGVSELVEYSMLSVNLLDYLQNTTFNEAKIEKFSKSFSAMVSDYSLNEIKDEVKVCNKILEIINVVGKGLYSLYVVISILYSVEAVLLDYCKEDKSTSALKFHNEYRKIMELCRKICCKAEWNNTIRNEISNIEIDTGILITCIEKTDYKLKKKEFEVLMKRDYSNPLLYKYAFSDGNRSIRKCALHLGLNNLPMDELLSGQDELVMDNISYDDIVQVCFFIIIKYSNYEDCEEQCQYKEMNLHALKCPLIETRAQAVENLEQFKGKFSSLDEAIINDSISSEIVTSIRGGLNYLIIRSEKRERKYVSTDYCENLGLHVKDAYLTSAHILGENNIDRSLIYNKLQEGDMVYFIIEDNEDDVHSIVVATINGYVIGYMPKPINSILIHLIKKDRYVYGKIEQISNDYKNICVGAYLSYKDVMEQIGNTLSLLSVAREDYIQ